MFGCWGDVRATLIRNQRRLDGSYIDKPLHYRLSGAVYSGNCRLSSLSSYYLPCVYIESYLGLINVLLSSLISRRHCRFRCSSKGRAYSRLGGDLGGGSWGGS